METTQPSGTATEERGQRGKEEVTRGADPTGRVSLKANLRLELSDEDAGGGGAGLPCEV